MQNVVHAYSTECNTHLALSPALLCRVWLESTPLDGTDLERSLLLALRLDASDCARVGYLQVEGKCEYVCVRERVFLRLTLNKANTESAKATQQMHTQAT